MLGHQEEVDARFHPILGSEQSPAATASDGAQGMDGGDWAGGQVFGQPWNSPGISLVSIKGGMIVDLLEDDGTGTNIFRFWDRQALAYFAQNLQRRLGNPRNRCFANSPLRLWSWAGVFISSTKLWKRTSGAAQAALAEEEAVDITHLASLRPLWNEFDDSVQDDASSFLAAVVDLAGSEEIVAGPRGGKPR